MAKQYRLQLDEETDDQRDPQRVMVSLRGDASSIVGWLLSIAETITQDDERAREQLYRLSVTQAERLGKQR
jgi:hypothetical protein